MKWYTVKLERSRGRKKTYEPLPDEYLADAEFNDLNGAFEAMVEFVSLRLDRLADARVQKDRSRSNVKAYIDLGHLNGEDLRVVVVPSVRSNPLESITRTSMGEPWSPVSPTYRPLLSFRTQEKFIRAFASWGIPVGITVVTAKSDAEGRAYKKVEAAAQDHVARGRGLRVFVWAQSSPDMESRPRFDPGRATPFTPFTLMHRVGDELNIGRYPDTHRALEFFGDNEYVRAFQAASEDFKDYYEMSSRAVPAKIREALEDDPAEGWGSLNGVMHLGVDTAAGRQMFFEDGPSDVFAKFILYRKWAYPDVLDLRRVTPVQMEQWAQALRDSYGVYDPTVNLVAVLGQYLRSGAYVDLRMYYTELLQRQVEAAIRMLEVSNGAIIV